MHHKLDIRKKVLDAGHKRYVWLRLSVCKARALNIEYLKHAIGH